MARDFTSPEWEETLKRLDHQQTFARMRNTPYYRDAVYAQFSRAEYERRFAALRAKMAENDLDVVICPGGPSHWSFGGGMLWLSGHWEWHCLAVYVVFPLNGEPTLIYGMGGTHIEAVRREVAVAISDVRSSRNGKFAEVMAERIREVGAERGRIGLLEVDPRHKDYMPANQYLRLKEELPGAEIVFTEGLMHELLVVKSAEELDCVRHAGRLCTNAMQALAERAKPGATEQDLRAAVGTAILEGGGDIDFIIIGSTPMDDPALVFGNPRPSLQGAAEGRHDPDGDRGGVSRLFGPDRAADLHRPAHGSRAAVLGRDREAGLRARHGGDRAGAAGVGHGGGRAVLPRQRLPVAAHRDARDRLRVGRAARLHRRGQDPRLRRDPAPRHGADAGAEPDFGGRAAWHVRRPHLHRHRGREGVRGRLAAGADGGLRRSGDEVARRFSVDEDPHHVVPGFAEKVPRRLHAHARDVGGEDQARRGGLGEPEERVVGGRGLGRIDIDRRAPELAAFQRRRQRRLVDDPAAGGVDEDGVGLHQAQSPRVDEVHGCGQERDVEAHHVRRCEERIEVHRPRTEARERLRVARRRGVVVDDRGAHRAERRGDREADRPHPDKADRQPAEAAVDGGDHRLPVNSVPARAQRPGRGPETAQERERGRHAVFRERLVRPSRHVGERDALLRQHRAVEPVDPRARHLHEPERRPPEERAGKRGADCRQDKRAGSRGAGRRGRDRPGSRRRSPAPAAGRRRARGNPSRASGRRHQRTCGGASSVIDCNLGHREEAKEHERCRPGVARDVPFAGRHVERIARADGDVHAVDPCRAFAREDVDALLAVGVPVGRAGRLAGLRRGDFHKPDGAAGAGRARQDLARAAAGEAEFHRVLGPPQGGHGLLRREAAGAAALHPVELREDLGRFLRDRLRDVGDHPAPAFRRGGGGVAVPAGGRDGADVGQDRHEGAGAAELVHVCALPLFGGAFDAVEMHEVPVVREDRQRLDLARVGQAIAGRSPELLGHVAGLRDHDAHAVGAVERLGGELERGDVAFVPVHDEELARPVLGGRDAGFDHDPLVGFGAEGDRGLKRHVHRRDAEGPPGRTTPSISSATAWRHGCWRRRCRCP